MKEITQEQFTQSARIFDAIDALKSDLVKAKTLTSKLAIKRQINALCEQRRQVLGMGDGD